MSSLILKNASRIIIPLGLLYAAYVALKGHNAPGGGFIGGLMFAVTLVLFRMAFGAVAFDRLVPFHPRLMVFTGLAVAFLTGLVPALLGYPFLTSWVGYVPVPLNEPVHLASAAAFDIGVLLVVVGVSTGMIARLSEELEL
jgi:multisubunit Na+/H+ antiporter MnhB subunit